MSSQIATKDGHSRVSIKTVHGSLNLPADQAATQHVPSTEWVRTYTPNTVGSWSTYSEFLLDPNALPDTIDTVTLVMQLSAATKSGGTVISTVGDAHFLSRLIEVSVGSELISSIYPEAGYLRSILHVPTETKTKLMPAAGNAAVATRRTNTAAGQTLAVDIPIPFILKGGYLAKSQAAPLRIKVYHANLTDIVQTDGTAPVMNISALSLNISGRSFQSQAALGAVVNTQRKLGRVDQRYLDPVQMQVALASGSAQFTVQLQSLVGLFDHVLFVVRAASSVSTALANDPTAFVAVQSYNLKDSGGNVIVPEITSAYALGPMLAKYVSGDATDIASGLGTVQKNVYSMFFGSRPEKSLSAGLGYGYVKLTGLERLQITFSSALSAAHVVDIVAYQLANLSADAVGTIKKTVVA